MIVRPNTPIPAGLVEYIWEDGNNTFVGALVCWLSVEPAEEPSWDCPGSPASVTVDSVFCCGVQIRGLLSADTLNFIADHYIEDAEADAREYRELRAYEDRALDDRIYF